MKKLITSASIIFIFNCSNAQQITFQKIYGGIGNNQGEFVEHTTDGGFIIAGSTNSFGAGSFDVYLIKTDTNGNLLWTKTFGGSGDERGNSVQQTTDGGYIIIGYTISFGAGDYDVYLIKTDNTGNLLWAKTFGGSGSDFGSSVQQTTDGGYIITGYTGSFGAGGGDVYLIKTDPSGNSIWTKTFGESGADWGYSVQQTTDGGFIIAGTITSSSTTTEAYLIKTDSNGNSLWTKTFGGIGGNDGRSIQQTTDGGYIIGGITTSFGVGGYDVYLFKTDSTGNLLWSKTFGGSGIDWGYSVKQTTDGGYIVAGYTNSFGAGNLDVYLIKTDTNGDTLWTKTYGGAGVDAGYSVQQTTDGGYIITGNTQSFGVGNTAVYLIKTDSLGNSGCNQGVTATIVTTPATIVTTPATIVTSPTTIATTPATQAGNGGTVTTLCITTGVSSPAQESKEVSVFPNPVSQELTVSLNHLGSLRDGVISKIKVFDIFGKEVLEKEFTSTTCKLNIAGLAKGIYFLRVQSKDGVVVRKFAVE